MPAESVLDRIVAAVRTRLAATPEPRDLARRAAEARRRSPRRSLFEALSADGTRVIAECKQASPSAGVLRPGLDPAALASRYQAAGAAAISVVTEPDFFQGRLEWLSAVREAVDLPVLRKDFIVDERQLREAAAAGADAVLLIQRILPRDRLAELVGAASDLGLEVLVELFADEDPAAALASGAEIIGVNARDLATFTTRLDVVEAIAGFLPPDRLRVAESGITCRADIVRLQTAGYDAFLVGEHLVRADDPGAALRRLIAGDAGR
ncbi:MAG TPA: indole-3-glycerol phosphate synthase TrpC [Candidatus Sulfomarinibacteraceae bacterium]|nr:indole-3-glycerol phosphate synthase TrpC [Candidatus Sulfomarinibacteraceae bacterium]